MLKFICSVSLLLVTMVSIAQQIQISPNYTHRSRKITVEIASDSAIFTADDTNQFYQFLVGDPAIGRTEGFERVNAQTLLVDYYALQSIADFEGGLHPVTIQYTNQQGDTNTLRFENAFELFFQPTVDFEGAALPQFTKGVQQTVRIVSTEKPWFLPSSSYLVTAQSPDLSFSSVRFINEFELEFDVEAITDTADGYYEIQLGEFEFTFHDKEYLFRYDSALFLGPFNPVNISESNDLEVTLYPNPAKQQIRFNNMEPIEVTIFNSEGKQVLHQPKLYPNLALNLENLPAGIYAVRSLDIQGTTAVQQLMITP